LQEPPNKVLILKGQSKAYGPLVDALKQHSEVTEIAGIDEAIAALRTDQYSAVFSDAGDFFRSNARSSPSKPT